MRLLSWHFITLYIIIGHYMTKLDRQNIIVQTEITSLCSFLKKTFAVSSPSGSTLAPGAGDAGPVDNAIPQGDNSSMEVEDVVRGALQSACSGDNSAPGDIPLTDVSADASVSATQG